MSYFVSFTRLFFLLTGICLSSTAFAETEVLMKFNQARANMVELGNADQIELFEQAKTRARNNNQVLVVVLTATWCGYCPSLLSQMQTVLEKRKDLAGRYLLHPVVVQTFEKVGDTKLYPDSKLGMAVVHQLFDPIADGSNLSLSKIVSGWPTIFMMDPSKESNLRIIDTDTLELPQERWEDGKYHNSRKILNFLKEFSFNQKLRCTQFF